MHHRLPIHRKGRELLKLAFLIQQHMLRGQKRLLGEKITLLCIEMVDLMAIANASRGELRAQAIRDVLQRVRTLETLLQVGHELKAVTTPAWAKAIELLSDIGRQGGGWLKSAKAPAV
ncbi:hypothetical protein GCM10010975_26850 [Comamonas phosphati]|nr:hypothetical protein GCM10010975_26850 [Comamonas phosphati]